MFHVVRVSTFVLILVLLFNGSVSRQARADDETPSEASSISHAEQLERDARELSRSLNLSDDLALTRLQGQHALGEALAEARAEYSDISASFVDIAEGAVVIRLNDNASSERFSSLEGKVNALSYRLEIRYGAEYSEEEFHSEATRLASVLYEARIDNDGVEYDAIDGELVLLLERLLPVDKLRELTSFPVRQERSSGETGPTLSGGVKMTDCTAGFSVRISGGKRGLLTAGHCGNSQKYSTTPGGSVSNTSSYVSGINNASTDMQWHHMTAHTPVASFYGSSASTATKRVGTGSAYVGQLLCHRGKTTGYSCGLVTSTAYAPPASWNVCGSSACAAKWVRVSGVDLANRRGDSGGPWFSGGYAYGIHTGGLIADTGAWAAYNPISRIGGLGVILI